MFKIRRVLSIMFVFGSVLSTEAFTASTIQEQMIQDLDVAKYHLSIKYGPAEWKTEHFGWSLENSYNKAKMRILDEHPTTPFDYQKILSQFLASTQDYHVNVSFHSTALSFFPFKVKKIGDSYYFAGMESALQLSSQEARMLDISDEDQKLIAKNIDRMTIGDEILELNGSSIRQVIEDLIQDNFNGDRTQTAYELVVRNLFFRRASLGHSTPSGYFKITLKSQKTKQLVTRNFPWIHMKELIPNHLLRDRYAFFVNPDDFSPETSVEMIDRLLAKDFSVGLAKDLALESIVELTRVAVGPRPKEKPEIKTRGDERQKGFLPALGPVLWESPKNGEIYAYLYKHPMTGQQIGYIYLPSFGKSGKEAEKYLVGIAKALQVFEMNAEGLVFDITDNTGGNVLFMYGLLSVLTDRPLKVPTHREIIIQEDVKKMALLYNFFEEMSLSESDNSKECLSGYPLTEKLINQIQSYVLTILQTWESGEVFTQPLYLFGVDEIMPHSIFNFKNKPIMVLVNSYTLSCGDFFPAILQDNKRALIFGQKTGGAGGYVKPYFHSSRFGVRGYSLTASIAYRLDGTPIENLGVTPDICYSLTRRDISENYFDYIKQLNSDMKNLINDH